MISDPVSKEDKSGALENKVELGNVNEGAEQEISGVLKESDVLKSAKDHEPGAQIEITDADSSVENASVPHIAKEPTNESEISKLQNLAISDGKPPQPEISETEDTNAELEGENAEEDDVGLQDAEEHSESKGPEQSDTTLDSIIRNPDTPSKRKLVGFAPEPEDDLKAHHEYLELRRQDKIKNNPFWKIPAQLAYLEPRKEAPKPLVNPFKLAKAPKRFAEIRDLRSIAVKEISVVNKQTELNFNYTEFKLPISADRVLVDIQYVTLSSFDISKISKYLVNLSDAKVGLGYNFSGIVVSVGARYESQFKVGMAVFGLTYPQDRKGSLLTSLLINPNRDILVPVTEETLTKIAQVDVKLSFSGNSFDVDSSDSSSDLSVEGPIAPVAPESKLKKDPYQIDEALDPIAKLSVFSADYCRAKQSLLLMDGVFRSQCSANILINGADTVLGYTLVQLLTSSAYDFLQKFNIILVCRDSSVAPMRRWLSRWSSGMHLIHVVAFDLESLESAMTNSDTNYKKVPFFAAELLECLFGALPASERVSASNLNNVKLDLLIDIVGCKKMFQKAITMESLDQVNFPFKEKLAPGASAGSLFGKSSEPLFIKLLKPKSKGASVVSYCRYSLSEPSYLIDELIDHSSKDVFNWWSAKWSLDVANQFVARYSYYEKFDLEIRRPWVDEALDLVLTGQVRMKVDDVVDWRSSYRRYIEQMHEQDGQTVFRVESF